VDILAKRRTPVEQLSIDVEGDRREEMPRRFLRLRITYRLDGAGIEAHHAERAVALAFEKYCSVAATLAPDTVVETAVVVNGVAGPAITQTLGR
jgi:putative redox protein